MFYNFKFSRIKDYYCLRLIFFSLSCTLQVHEDEWGSHRVKNIPIICPDSYRSHEDYNNREHIFQHIKYINV